VTKEDIQNAVDFFYGKTEKKESKETMEKPQLESENYKIDK
jgi:DNA gyrase inhibitor GyrI